MSQIIKQKLFADLPALTKELQEVFNTFQKTSTRFELDSEFVQHMTSFVTAGKLFRGCLLLATYEALTGKKNTSATLQVAAALELYCSGLLVQDDIMDRDNLRRGKVASHILIQNWAEDKNLPHAAHFGESVAICYGDVLYFMATELLSTVALPAETKLQLLTVSSRELTLLGLAQCEDMRLAALPVSAVTQKEVLAMEYGKTGRYTGRWPLALAGILAACEAQVIEQLAQVGDELGLLYQLRDDYLGIFGDSEKTGKNTTTDIQEGKKTHFYLYALSTLRGSEREFAGRTFGNSAATGEDIEKLKRILHEKGIVAEVEAEIQKHNTQLQQQIAALPLPSSVQELLRGVTELVLQREK